MSLKKLFNLPKIHLPKVSGHPIFLLANYFLLFMVKSLLFAMKISNMKSNLPEYYNQKQNWLRLGQKLLNFAVKELNADKVDVNEQNIKALKFYQKFGFEIFERTDKDDKGRNYPLLRMKLVHRK